MDENIAWRKKFGYGTNEEMGCFSMLSREK